MHTACKLAGKRKDQHHYVFRIQNVCDDIPGWGICPLLLLPPPGICHPKLKNAKAWDLARGGGEGMGAAGID